MNENEIKNNRNNKFIITLLILAGIKVFVFSAAFPMCNNVDEPAHLDMVHKYSRGHIPKNGIENYDRGTLELLLLYASPEYLTDSSENQKKFIMLWKQPNIRETEKFQNILKSCLNNINHETGSFPVYYLWAGLWWRFGEFTGLSDWKLMYLIRFLNVPVFMAMVWLAWLTGKTLFPENNFQQKGLAIMAAAFPQDSFYSITNDALSPFLFSLSFFMLIKILFEDKKSGFYLCTAAVIAVTFLNKITNITMLALLGPVIIYKLRQVISERKFKGHFFRLFILIAISIIPLCLWMIRNHIVLGDMTGSAAKNSHLGWTAKSFSHIWDHPIFSISGIAFFLGELTRTFWRGEFVWYLKRISSEFFDFLYAASTGFFILASFLALFRNKDKKERIVLGISFILIAASVMMLAGLSTIYDFGSCWYPSQEHPYFTSGRLIVTALIPFLIIYLYGMEKVLLMFRLKFNPLIVVIIFAVAIILSEILLSLKVFASPYNWFHLWQSIS